MFHSHKAIAGLFGPHLLRLDDYIKSAQDAVADGPEIYRERVAFAAAGFRVAQLYISADQLVRSELANEKDPELRGKIRLEATNRYRDLLEMFQSPQYRSRLIEIHPFENDLRQEIKYLEEGTTFGIGDFTYWEWCPQGGRTAMNADVRNRWTYDSDGLHLSPKTTGVLVYRFRAADGGVFSEAKVKFLIFEHHETLSNELAISTDNGRTYHTRFRNRNMTNSGATEPDETEQNLTELVAGKSEFLVKLEAHNSGNREARSLLRVVVRGNVEPDG